MWLDERTLAIPLTPKKRPPLTGAERIARMREKRITRGLCRECGKHRKGYSKQRCRRCARKEARRVRKYGPQFHTIVQRSPEEKRALAKQARFIARCAAIR